MKPFVLPALLAATFTGGLVVGQRGPFTPTSTPHATAAPARVFELRTYTTPAGQLPALQRRFREHTMEIFQRHGMTNIGYWTPEDSTRSQNTIVYLLAFPTRQAARDSWAAFGADPEWRKVQAASEAHGKIVEKVESVFLDPTDFSPIQ